MATKRAARKRSKASIARTTTTPSKRARKSARVTSPKRATARTAVVAAHLPTLGPPNRVTGTIHRIRRGPPYVRRLEPIGRIAVWQVDGDYVRKNITAEFNDFGHHYSFNEIPRNEIWLDIEKAPDEQQLLVRQAMTERRLMALGMDYEAARAVAIAEERRMRDMASATGS